MKDELGDYIKSYYETPESSRRVNFDDILLMRLDGRSFSKFTKNFKKPVDEIVSNAMIETAKYMVDQFHAYIGYVQSDEITLVLTKNDENSEYPFNGKYQKLCSVSSGIASVKFFSEIQNHTKKLPHFDCRIFGVPNMDEANKVLEWRRSDAIRNSILSMGQSVIGKKKIVGLGTNEVRLMLLNDYDVKPDDLGQHFAYGTFLKRISKPIRLSDERWDSIPENHRPNNRNFEFMRSEVELVRYDQIHS